jgi:hypothetical protein
VTYPSSPWSLGADRSAGLTWGNLGPRRDLFMTYTSGNRSLERSQSGLSEGPPGLRQYAYRQPDLRFYVERVTGIEPAWPAWKAQPGSEPRVDQVMETGKGQAAIG